MWAFRLSIEISVADFSLQSTSGCTKYNEDYVVIYGMKNSMRPFDGTENSSIKINETNFLQRSIENQSSINISALLGARWAFDAQLSP